MAGKPDEVLTPAEFGRSVHELATAVVDSGYEPDSVLAIARGGLGMAMALGWVLDVKDFSVVNVAFCTGVDRRLDVPIMAPPTPSAIELTGLRVLVADDVAGTGRTLEYVSRFVARHVAEALTAVIHAKPRSVVEPHNVWRRTDRWIDFPWSSAPPLVNRS